VVLIFSAMRGSVSGLAVAAEDWKLWVFQTLMTISARIREVIKGDVGGFAAAVTTGDRSGMSQAALGDLRAAIRPTVWRFQVCTWDY